MNANGKGDEYNIVFDKLFHKLKYDKMIKGHKKVAWQKQPKFLLKNDVVHNKVMFLE